MADSRFEETAFSAKASASATSTRATEKTVFVDVGAKKIDANVSRNGLPVGVFEVDTDVLDPIIVTRPTQKLRVVSQSVRAGTPVAIGTSISLTLAPAGKLPVGVVTGTHQVVKGLEIDAAYAKFVNGKPQVNRIISRAAAGPLSREDEQAVKELFAAEGVNVTDTPGHDVTAAVETLRVLTAFGG